jgi:hypothetical protein
MIQRTSDQPRGQIILMVAFALVVLLGILALAFDLGFSWMLHRKEQNAADPAAIAAARWLKDSLGNAVDPVSVQAEMNADACFYAQQNGFFVTDVGCATALAAGDLQVHSPPVRGDHAGSAGKVQVIIHDTHPTFFARIWGQREAAVVTAAVAANDTGNSNSSSLVALQPICEGGSAGTVTGGGTVNIFPTDPGTPGGYVHINSPCGDSTDDDCENGSGSSALDVSGGGTLITPFAYVVGTCVENGNNPGNANPGLWCDQTFTSDDCIDEDSYPPLADPLAGVPEPEFDNFPNGMCPDGSESTPSSTAPCDLKKSSYCPPDPDNPSVDICTLAPGVYYGGWSVGSRVRLFLEPGMYILAGGGIKLSGTEASIEAVTSPLVGDARIMIFSTDGPGCPGIGAQCQGDITFTAQQAFRAKALNAATCGLVTPNACPWKGILLWQDGTASNPDAPVKLGGQSSTILAGTIYAPLADVTITGGSGTTGCPAGPTAGCLAIQIISYTWKISGDGWIDMPYDPAGLYQFPSRGLID